MDVTGEPDNATEDSVTDEVEATVAAFIGWPAELAASRNSAERKEVYTRYIASPAWQSKRIGALERAGHRCQVCNGKNRLQVHHRTYERVGDENAGDLTVLCRRCHEIFHGQRSVSQPAKPKRKQRQGVKGRRSGVTTAPCPMCRKNWTTKSLCKPCRRLKRQGKKPPPMKPLPPDPRTPAEKTFTALAAQLNKAGRERAKMTRAERMRGQWQDDGN